MTSVDPGLGARNLSSSRSARRKRTVKLSRNGFVRRLVSSATREVWDAGASDESRPAAAPFEQTSKVRAVENEWSVCQHNNVVGQQDREEQVSEQEDIL